MASRNLIVGAALLAATSIPAAASVVVVGSSSARLCYEAADSAALPSRRDLTMCDDAFADPSISHRDTIATYINRGIVKLRRGAVDAAIVDFDAAITMDPRQPESYLNKGAALVQRNDPRGALPLFTVALEYRTERPEMAHFGRAIANEDLGNLPAAYADYRRASELARDWEQARVELARFRLAPN